MAAAGSRTTEPQQTNADICTHNSQQKSTDDAVPKRSQSRQLFGGSGK